MGTSWSSLAREEEAAVNQAFLRSSPRINVLLLGLPAAGKSALVRSLDACVAHGEPPEPRLLPIGQISNDESFTFQINKYEMFSSSSHGQDYGSTGEAMTAARAGDFAGRAAVFDMPGLPAAEPNERTESLLRCILQGRVPINCDVTVLAGQSGAEVDEMFQTRWEGSNLDSVNQGNGRGNTMIDRVVLVHSCKEQLPYALIHSVQELCNELDINVFSVLTHIDQRPWNYLRFFLKLVGYDHGELTEEDLALAVGTYGSPRSIEVQLYEESMRRELPRSNYFLLHLWRALLNPNYRIRSSE